MRMNSGLELTLLRNADMRPVRVRTRRERPIEHIRIWRWAKRILYQSRKIWAPTTSHVSSVVNASILGRSLKNGMDERSNPGSRIESQSMTAVTESGAGRMREDGRAWGGERVGRSGK